MIISSPCLQSSSDHLVTRLKKASPGFSIYISHLRPSWGPGKDPSRNTPLWSEVWPGSGVAALCIYRVAQPSGVVHSQYREAAGTPIQAAMADEALGSAELLDGFGFFTGSAEQSIAPFRRKALWPGPAPSRPRGANRQPGSPPGIRTRLAAGCRLGQSLIRETPGHVGSRPNPLQSATPYRRPDPRTVAPRRERPSSPPAFSIWSTARSRPSDLLQLDRRARAIAARLQEMGLAGERRAAGLSTGPGFHHRVLRLPVRRLHGRADVPAAPPDARSLLAPSSRTPGPVLC